MKNKEITVGNVKRNLNIFELQDQFLMDNFNQNTEAIADAVNQLDKQDESAKSSAEQAISAAKNAITAANLATTAANKATNEMTQFSNFKKVSSSGITAVSQTNVDIYSDINKIPLQNKNSSGSAFSVKDGNIVVSSGTRLLISGKVKVSGAKYGDSVAAGVFINDGLISWFYDIVPISSISASLKTTNKKLGTALNKKSIAVDGKKVLSTDTELTKTEIAIANGIDLKVNSGNLFITIPNLVINATTGAKISLKIKNTTAKRGRAESGISTFLTVVGLA